MSSSGGRPMGRAGLEIAVSNGELSHGSHKDSSVKLAISRISFKRACGSSAINI